MRVLGIDPGLASTGYGVLERRGPRFAALDCGVIRTPAGRADEMRLAMLFDDLGALFDEHSPDAVALEGIYFGQNASSAFAVGQARGVVLLAAGRRGLPCSSYTPQQVKQAVCGSGRAAKDQVARMTCSQLALDAGSLPDHATDALAVGFCHLGHAPLRAVMAEAR